MAPSRMHYVCLPCRKSFKYYPGPRVLGYQPETPGACDEHLCPQCRRPLINAGHDFAPPRRTDKAGWKVVAAVLTAGLWYEGWDLCGCGRDPKFRPRTNAELRARCRLAVRTGIPDRRMLSAADPYAPGPPPSPYHAGTRPA